MKIIKTMNLEKYADRGKYTQIEAGIYEDATGGVGGQMGITQGSVYCVTLYCELEEGEDTQYPLEDILDKYFVNCTDVFEEKEVDGKRIFIVEIEGERLDRMKEIADFVGKRVFNYKKDGYVKLGVEG